MVNYFSVAPPPVEEPEEELAGRSSDPNPPYSADEDGEPKPEPQESPSGVQEQSENQNSGSGSQLYNPNDPWGYTDPYLATNTDLEGSCFATTQEEPSSDVRKNNEEMKKGFERLGLQTRSQMQQKSLLDKRKMSLQDRMARDLEEKHLQGSHADLSVQLHLRAQQQGDGRLSSDLPRYEFYRLTDRNTFSLSKNGQKEMIRAPLQAILAAGKTYPTKLFDQKVDDGLEDFFKAMKRGETHSKLDLLKYQVAALKQHLYFSAHAVRCMYKMHSGLLRDQLYDKLGDKGPVYSYLLGAWAQESIGALKATQMVLSNDPASRIEGKRYLDLHPGDASKGWYDLESKPSALLSRKPMPHPQVNYGQWMEKMKSLGYKPQNSTPKSAPNKGRNNPSANAKGKKGKGAKNKKKGTKRKRQPDFWKRHAWSCGVCNVIHPKGFHCPPGLAAPNPKRKKRTPSTQTPTKVDD